FAALALFLAGLNGLPASAQTDEPAGGLGLDLTDEGQKKEQEQKKQASEPKEPKKEDDGSTRPSLGAAPSTEAEKAQAVTGAMQGERDITQDDRVKSVQRKVYLRNGRFE